jgi:hypothetical protein
MEVDHLSEARPKLARSYRLEAYVTFSLASVWIAGCDAILGITDTNAVVVTSEAGQVGGSAGRGNMDAGGVKLGAMDAGAKVDAGTDMDSGAHMDARANMDVGTDMDSMTTHAALDGSKRKMEAGAEKEAGSTRPDASQDPDIDESGVVPIETVTGPCTPYASDENDAGPVPSSEWTPLALRGLVMWLDAAQCVTTRGSGANKRVIYWRDLSRHHNDASSTPETTAPLWISTSANGRPTLQFDGQRDYLRVADAPSLNFGTGDFTVEVVAQWNNATLNDGIRGGYGMLFSKQQEPWPYVGYSLLANVTLSDNSTSSRLSFLIYSSDVFAWVAGNRDGLNDGRFRLYGAQRTDTHTDAGITIGTSLEVRVHGSFDGALAVPASATADSQGAVFEIGSVARNGISQSLDGAISEIILVRGAITVEERAGLESYLTSKYRLAQ